MPVVKLTAKIDSAKLKQFYEKLEKKGAFKPYACVVGDENVYYAQYTEFGSGPAHKKSPDRDVKEEIRKWVRRKLAPKSPKDEERITQAIYHRVMENGLPPRPFFRPAIHDFERYFPEDYFLNGGTIESAAEEFAELVRKNLMVEEMGDGPLYQSVRVVPLEDLDKDESSATEQPPKEIWDSDYLSSDGKDRRGERRGRRR